MPEETSESEEGLNDEVDKEGDKVVFIDTNDEVPRKFYISKRDALKFGYTKGCPGCMSWSKGTFRKPHTQACRERFAKLLEDQSKF